MFFIAAGVAFGGALALAQSGADGDRSFWGKNAICIPVQDDQLGAHGVGHAEMHSIYKNWHPPQNPGTSCCNNADCRPTRAFVDNDGHWRAWNGSAWLSIPQERVLPANFAGDGRSHICEKNGFVYCFSPGEIRG
jgi:hypothetical protein